jgi:hypothetical protein
MDEVKARVYRDDKGQLVLEDSVAEGVIAAVNSHNYRLAMLTCRKVFEAQHDRIKHFTKRAVELGYTNKDLVIVLINVDTEFGRPLAEMLMPDHDWQQYRDKGEIPFARGLAGREGVQAYLDAGDKLTAAEDLKLIEGLAVVVIDCEVAAVFYAETVEG